jgi:hypothetical protein
LISILSWEIWLIIIRIIIEVGTEEEINLFNNYFKNTVLNEYCLSCCQVSLLRCSYLENYRAVFYIIVLEIRNMEKKEFGECFCKIIQMSEWPKPTLQEE